VPLAHWLRRESTLFIFLPSHPRKGSEIDR
jgi:hypothetical protein